MRKFLITWDSGDNDGETVVTADSEGSAEDTFTRKYPNREVISVKEM